MEMQVYIKLWITICIFVLLYISKRAEKCRFIKTVNKSVYSYDYYSITLGAGGGAVWLIKLAPPQE
jgi:hypothetical protein